MHIIIKKGGCVNTTNTTFLSVFFTWLMAVSFLMTAFHFSPTLAQDAPSSQRPKPQLVKIVFNEETNDPKALEIAKKLDENVDETYIALFNNFEDKRILFVRANDSRACGNAGCYTAMYIEQDNNRWKHVLEALALNVYYDQNSTSRYKNIITQLNYSREPLKVWMWNGDRYVNVKRN
jgi:hypothetical protein